jgi:predicted nucleotidyltransferase
MKNKDNFNLLILKALKFFIENPYEEIYLREFSRKLDINTNSAQRYLNQFLNQGIIIETRKGNLRYFKANFGSIFFRQIKITYSIKKLEDSGLLGLLKNSFSSVILFGSTAKGEDNNLSDIDLVCIGPNKNINLDSAQKNLDKQLNVHFYKLSEWKEASVKNKAFYLDVISTGINLIGDRPIV